MKDMLKSMKKTLIEQTQAQIMDLQCVDYHELGAAIDMIKDLEEALYYCTIIESMEESEEAKNGNGNGNNTYYYTESRYIPMKDDMIYYRDMDRPYGKMYYVDGEDSSYHTTTGMRDSREGRSPLSRRQYMESKELHKDKATQLKDLEKYMQELTSDIAEMIEDSTPEEKQLLQKKISSLATKIDQLK